MSKNIAEGSGSDSPGEFRYYLNIARRSVFENANILIILDRKKIIDEKEVNTILERLDILARKISIFRRSLGIEHSS